MCKDEAEKVAAVVATADHRCSYCVEELTQKLNAEFPEFVWTYSEEEGEVSVEDRLHQ